MQLYVCHTTIATRARIQSQLRLLPSIKRNCSCHLISTPSTSTTFPFSAAIMNPWLTVSWVSPIITSSSFSSFAEGWCGETSACWSVQVSKASPSLDCVELVVFFFFFRSVSLHFFFRTAFRGFFFQNAVSWLY